MRMARNGSLGKSRLAMREISMEHDRQVENAIDLGTSRIRVLFIAEAVTLAHVARVHALAQLLDPSVYEICIASDPRYDGLIGEHSFAARSIFTISTARFAAALKKGAPIYDTDTLAAYAEEDTQAIEAFAPDVVIGDFRLSLNVSARLVGKPYINITNAGWSPYARVKFTVPDIALPRWLGVPVAQRLFDLTRPLAFAAHAMPLNGLRKRYGLRPLPYDLREVYTDADFVLYADIPELFSMRPLPPHHAFIGAVLWSPESPLPAWWASLLTDRPMIYVTLGSSGQSSLLSTVIAALAGMSVTVIAATAGRVQLDHVPANAFVADYLPGTLAARRANLVICNGGSPTCYQALAASVPILGIPSNLDQFLNMGAVEAAGAGSTLRPQSVSPLSVSKAVDVMLRTASYQRSAERLMTSIGARQPALVLTATLKNAVPSAHSNIAARG